MMHERLVTDGLRGIRLNVFGKLLAGLLITTVTSSPVFVRASDLLTSAEKVFYRSDATRAGIEVEFWGLTPQQAAQVVAQNTGGKISVRKTKLITTLKETKPDGTRVYNTEDAMEFVVSTPEFGELILKPDSNQVDDIHHPDPSLSVVELVTPPVVEPQVERLQPILSALAAAGARGTDEQHAVSTQTNIEVAGGQRDRFDQRQLEGIVNLIRLVIHHEKQMREEMVIPAIRAPYIMSFSPGLKRKLMDPNYVITARGLYDDVIYRQSLELQGHRDAWTLPIEQARKKLLSQEHQIVPQVVKQNFFRVSSLLMWLFPDDPMSKIYDTSGWAKARPLIEWRGFNNTFDIVAPFRQSVGLSQAALKYGAFDHDHLMRSMVGIEERTTRELRARSLQSRKDGKPFLFRYFMGDPASVDREDYAHLRAAYTDVVGFLAPQQTGEKPMVVPGESVVFHRLPIHRDVVVGKYNPTLINTFIIQALENKYAEARFWNEYVPGTMPETVLLEDLVRASDNIEATVQKLNTRFPKGWVLKGVWDIGSEKQIITDKTEVVAEVSKYRASDYDKFRAEVTKRFENGKGSFDDFQYAVAQHPGYKGWKISQILSKPEVAIVQARMEIEREFRVEVITGKVLGNGSTVDRYKYEYELNGRSAEYVPPPQEMIRTVEAFAQNAVNALPQGMRSMTFGMDIAIVKNSDGKKGAWGYRAMMVESNPGGASNFLHEEGTETIRALGERLKTFPNEVKRGMVHPGLSARDQMRFLAMKFRDWRIDPRKLYSGMIFKRDRIIDPFYLSLKPKVPEYRMLRSRSPAPICRDLFGARAG